MQHPGKRPLWESAENFSWDFDDWPLFGVRVFLHLLLFFLLASHDQSGYLFGELKKQ